MSLRQVKKYAAVFFGLASTTLAGHAFAVDGLVEQAAPAFELKSEGGGKPGATIKLSDYKGRIVLMNFWASWCGPCREEMPLLEDLYNKYKDQGLVVLGINVDSEVAQAMKFLDKEPVTFPILLDSESAVSEKYQVDAMPTTYIIDRDGTIKAHHRGYRDGFMDKYDQEIQELLNPSS